MGAGDRNHQRRAGRRRPSLPHQNRREAIFAPDGSTLSPPPCHRTVLLGGVVRLLSSPSSSAEWHRSDLAICFDVAQPREVPSADDRMGAAPLASASRCPGWVAATSGCTQASGRRGTSTAVRYGRQGVRGGRRCLRPRAATRSWPSDKPSAMQRVESISADATRKDERVGASGRGPELTPRRQWAQALARARGRRPRTPHDRVGRRPHRPPDDGGVYGRVRSTSVLTSVGGPLAALAALRRREALFRWAATRSCS
jgi:hypothetical protein